MPLLRILLSPSQQNPAQKLGFFASLVFSALILMLHFPFDGYVYEHNVVTRYGTEPCPETSLGTLRQMTQEDLLKYAADLKRCSNDEEMQVLPISQWRSTSPLVEWFGSVIHAVSALVLILLLGGLWLWLYQTTDSSK